MKKLDIYLIAVISFMMLFTIAMVVVFCVKGYVPDTLIQMAFTYFLGECGFCGVIKAIQTFKESKTTDNKIKNTYFNNTNGHL